MPEECPRFDAFTDAHFGLGLRWRKSMFFTGVDFSIAVPFACILFSTGSRVVRK